MGSCLLGSELVSYLHNHRKLDCHIVLAHYSTRRVAKQLAYRPINGIDTVTRFVTRKSTISDTTTLHFAFLI